MADMVNWVDVQEVTERALTSVNQQMAFYQQRIEELANESRKLKTALEVAKSMQESGYVQRLVSAQTIEAGSQVPSASQEKPSDTPAAFTLHAPRVEPPKPKWQTSIDELAELPDLPPAVGLRRQPNKSNTSYRAAALLKEAGHDLHIDDIINEFKKRNWVDPNWARPKEAITIAVKRSVTYGWTQPTGKYTYVYSPHGQDSSQQTSEDNYESEGGEDLI